MKKNIHIDDFTRPGGQVTEIDPAELSPFRRRTTRWRSRPSRKLTEDQRKRMDASLDGVVAIGLAPPKTPEEEKAFVEKFLAGIEKLFSVDDNWTFLQPLVHTLEYCVKCQICSDACPAYVSSGRQDIYRPTMRPELLRRIVSKYIKKEHPLLRKFKDSDIDLNWQTLARLAELAYRCTLCRRCAQVCPLGCDNALISREIRKVFSQQMGIAPKEIHEKGSVQQLRVGSSTGMTPAALKNIVEFAEEEIEEKTGRKIKIPVDKKGADILLIHNAGEFIAWPENLEAFAIILDAAGVDWTLSSEICRLRFRQLRRLVRRFPVCPGRHPPVSGGKIARGPEDLPRRMRPRPQGADRHRRPCPDGRSQHPPGEQPPSAGGDRHERSDQARPQPEQLSPSPSMTPATWCG